MANANNENIFDIIDEIRTYLQDKIVTNQELLKYLDGKSGSPLSLPDYTMDEAWSLVGDTGCIFFNPLSERTTIEQKTLLLCLFEINSSKRDYVTITLFFIIMVNNEINELDNGSSRLLKICRSIDDTFKKNKSNKWLGEISLNHFRQITAPSGYQGMELSYKLTGFNW